MRWHVTVLSTFLFVTLHSSKSTLAQQTDNSRPSDIPASIAVTTSSPSPDLVLISPQDPNFDETERHLLGIAASGPALDLKLFLVILFNRSVGTVVAYEMVWKITHTDKTVEISSADANYPDGVVAVPARASERPLMSGEQRLIGVSFSLIHPGLKQMFRMRSWKQSEISKPRCRASSDWTSVSMLPFSQMA